MSQNRTFAGSAVANLRLLEVFPRGFLYRSRRGFGRVTVTSAGVFRVQHAPTRKGLERPSWAVVGWAEPNVGVRVRQRGKVLTLSTGMGSFRFHLQSGAWSMGDPAGRVCFECPAGQTRVGEAASEVGLRLAPDEALFGLGETSGPMNKRGLVREFWNQDVLGHASAIHPGLRALYTSIPFALSLRAGRAAGLFWDQPARQVWDLGQKEANRWVMRGEAPEIDLYLMRGPEVASVVRAFTDLTGHMPLPPMWGLGYHQCRYSYATARRVQEIARLFRRKRIPCDALYLDIDHMDGYRVFTFGKAFPRPAALCARMARKGFRVVAIVDPGVKDDPGFAVLRRGKQLGAFVKRVDGKTDYVGKVWPGAARFPDFLNRRVREWWAREQARWQHTGVSGVWNDMNEPADFAGPGKTLPLDCRHDSDFGPLRHAPGHNVYGMQMARASRTGALLARPDERPFVITRAAYAGIQRYGLVWTGDNSSCWEHLQDAVQMLLNLGISGVPYCGADVGGFLDNATPELFLRWLQMAVFTPFLRNHSNTGTKDQEPWAFGKSVEGVAREYIELRYRLLPYLYCLLAEARAKGTPLMRPLYWMAQLDAVARGIEDAFLLGSGLLVAPVTRPGVVARSVYLPAGTWFDFWTGQRTRGSRHMVADAPLERIPIYARAGTLLPLGPVQQYTGEVRSGTVELHVWPGEGILDWYEDDGKSQAYASGVFYRRRITMRPRGRGMEIVFHAPEGSYAPLTRVWRVVVHGGNSLLRVAVGGGSLRGKSDLGADGSSFDVPNLANVMQVRWERIGRQGGDEAPGPRERARDFPKRRAAPVWVGTAPLRRT